MCRTLELTKWVLSIRIQLHSIFSRRIPYQNIFTKIANCVLWAARRHSSRFRCMQLAQAKGLLSNVIEWFPFMIREQRRGSSGLMQDERHGGWRWWERPRQWGGGGRIGGCATKIMLTLTLRFPSSIQRPRSLIYLPHTPHPYSRAREVFVFRADRGGGGAKSFPLNLKSEFACRWPPRGVIY